MNQQNQPDYNQNLSFNSCHRCDAFRLCNETPGSSTCMNRRHEVYRPRTREELQQQANDWHQARCEYNQRKQQTGYL